MKKEWKQLFDELELQLALGQAEGRLAYEEQKTKMKSVLRGAREKLFEMKLTSQDQKEELKARLEEAELQLALGKAEGKDAFEGQKTKIEKAVSDLHHAVSDVKHEGDEKLKNWQSELDQNVLAFQVRMDIYKLHFALGKLEAEDKREEYREALSSKIRESKEKLEDLKDETEERLDTFGDDMKDALDQMGGAFKKLFA